MAERAPDVDRQATFPLKNFELLYDEGVLGLSAGGRHGGYDAFLGGDHQLYASVLERFGAACGNTAHCFSPHSWALAAIRVFGSPEQHEYFAREVVEEGAIFGHFGSEPEQEFSSDGERLQPDTTARRVADGWEITGRKFFATNSTHADYHLIYALPEGSDSIDDFLYPVVDADAQGVTVYDTWDGMGLRATASGAVAYDGVFVPDEHVIGELGDIVEHDLFGPSAGISLSSRLAGYARGALEFTRWYLEHESKPPSDLPSLAHDPHVQLHVGEMDVQVTSAKEMVSAAARAVDAAQDDPSHTREAEVASLRAKVVATEASLNVTSRLFQICGARATRRALDADRFWRNTRTLTLHDPIDKHTTDVGRRYVGLDDQRHWTD